MVSRAIEVGQSLLANQSEKLAERDRILERNRRKWWWVSIGINKYKNTKKR